MKKKFFLMIALLVIGATGASAQTVWGLRFGASSYTEKVTVEGLSLDLKSVGVEIGPVFYYLFKNNLYLNSGAMLGIQISGAGDYEKVYQLDSYQNFLVDIPVYLGIKIPVGSSNTVSLFGQAGPYFGYCFSTNDIINDALRPFQSGLGIMGGVNVKRFKFELGYKYGLTNFMKVDPVSSKLTSLFLGVSFVF